MSKSKHFRARMDQRAIKSELVDLTLKFGVQFNDKIVLNKRGLQCLISELRSMERAAKAGLDKGGIVIVESDGILITGYRLNSYKRKAS
jgi:hypothetical protein